MNHCTPDVFCLSLMGIPRTHIQRVSEAYKCLTDPNYVDDDEADVDLSEEEMFSMFNSMFRKCPN
jgi:hypothetical protein